MLLAAAMDTTAVAMVNDINQCTCGISPKVAMSNESNSLLPICHHHKRRQFHGHHHWWQRGCAGTQVVNGAGTGQEHWPWHSSFT